MYVVGYSTKDESGMTKFLNECLKKHDHLELKDLLKELGKCFVTSRQIAQPESTYRLFPQMKLKDSNITFSIYSRTMNIIDKHTLKYMINI